MKRLALVLSILLLAACDREPKVDMKDASVAEVAKKVDAVNERNNRAAARSLGVAGSR